MSEEARPKKTERHVIREERLTRPEKMALEERVAQPGAEYVEVGWRKTAPEDLVTIRERIDALIGHSGRARHQPREPSGSTRDLPPGLRSRITDAYGPVAYVRLAYTTKEHHVCRVGLRADNGTVREIVLLVTPDEVRPVDSVEDAVDKLPAPASQPVAITRVQFDPPGPDSGANLVNEWVEITNRGPSAVDLTGWRLEDRAGKHYAFPEGFTLDVGASVKVRTGQGKDAADSLYWGRRAAVWNNQGDTAVLRDARGRYVSRQAWAPE